MTDYADMHMGRQCHQPCRQCAALRPLRDALRMDGWEVTLETQMGGGVHAVHVRLPDGWYAYLNDEGFSLYDDNRPGVDEYDEEGFAHLSWSTDDPPSPRQQAVLFRLRVAQHLDDFAALSLGAAVTRCCGAMASFHDATLCCKVCWKGVGR